MSVACLVDTSVLSELMRGVPVPAVMAWFARRPDSQIHTRAITQAETLAGIALLPRDHWRDALAHAADQLFGEGLRGRVISFDSAAAPHFALVRAQRQRAGRPIITEDAQTAAKALAAKLLLVTSNTKDFEDIDGLTLLNLWNTQ